jgi:hypothetical protein
MDAYFYRLCLAGLGLMIFSAVLPLRAGPTLQVKLEGNNTIISWPATNNAFGVEYSTDPRATAWIALPNVNIVGTNYVVTNQVIDLARFYRLISPCGEIAPPTLGPVSSQNVTGTRYILCNGDAIIDPDTPAPIFGNAVNVLDASAFIDPSSCVPGTLSYHWVVTYIRSDDGTEITPYTDAGITGYLNPVLKISPNAMPPGEGYVTLTVTSRLHPEHFVVTTFDIEIDDSSRLQVSNYLSCRATGTLCDRQEPGCLCFISAALPTTEPTQ